MLAVLTIKTDSFIFFRFKFLDLTLIPDSGKDGGLVNNPSESL